MGFLISVLMTLASAGDPSEGYGFGYFGYSHHNTTLSPDWTGYKKDYSGSSSLYPTVAAVNVSSSHYYKMDFEGLFAALMTFVGAGSVEGQKAGTNPGGSPIYLFHASGTLLNRNEWGLNFPTSFGLIGFGANLDLMAIGLDLNKDATKMNPGACFDIGPQLQYFLTIWPGFRVNPSVTYNFLFTDGPDKLDGWGLNFEAATAFKVLPIMSLYGNIGYDIRNFTWTDGGGGGSSSRAQLKDLTLRFSLAFHNIFGYGSN